MISVITYGRNDNYSYNLVKRTAFSFNCLAEVMDDENDEILFVDYNTPDHLPTLPEAIWDTLTEKALARVKVIRISREIHETIKGDSPLPILENVSRNAAIMRSNPANRWMLSTNPDVLLVLASKWPNLDALLQTLPDSFYELPRFDIPESVWSSLRRDDPRKNMTVLRDWLLHKKVAVAETVPDCRFQNVFLFDAPGDFQLAPRAFFLRLHGFDESMNKYLHSDSNLAKRMWLLNGKHTDHLLSDLWVLHQDHYLSGEWARNVGDLAHNDYFSKVLHEETIEANGQGWGLQDLDLPMFRLGDITARRQACLANIPTTAGVLTLSDAVNWETQRSYRLFHYNLDGILPYLRENLQVLPKTAQIAYLGHSLATLEAVAQMWKELCPEGKPLIDLAAIVDGASPVPTDLLIVDFHYERPEHWERQISLFRERMNRRLKQGAITAQEAAEEVSTFADSADTGELERQLVPLWKKLLPKAILQSSGCVILLGCNLYVQPYSRFQETYAAWKGLRAERTHLQKLRGAYQELGVNWESGARTNFLVGAFLTLRRFKRNAFRTLLGHNSVMGMIHLRHDTSRRKHLNLHLDLQSQYVHHRLVVLRVK